MAAQVAIAEIQRRLEHGLTAEELAQAEAELQAPRHGPRQAQLPLRVR